MAPCVHGRTHQGRRGQFGVVVSRQQGGDPVIVDLVEQAIAALEDGAAAAVLESIST